MKIWLKVEEDFSRGFSIGEINVSRGEHIEVDSSWWDRYKYLAREFSSMQDEAARLAGFDVEEEEDDE